MQRPLLCASQSSPSRIGKQSFQRRQVVAFNQEIPAARIANGKFAVALQQAIRHFPMMVENCFLSYLIKRRHRGIWNAV